MRGGIAEGEQRRGERPEVSLQEELRARGGCSGFFAVER